MTEYNDRIFQVKNSDELYAHALGLFFGMRPISPWWILVVMHLAKTRKLKLVTNSKPTQLTLAYMDMTYAKVAFDKNILEEWESKGINSLSLEAEATDDSPVVNIISELCDYFRIKKSRNASAHFGGLSDNFFDFGQWEPSYLFEVAEDLMAITDEWYESNSKRAFFDVLQRIQRNAGKTDGDFIQPIELTHLATSLLDAENGTVYNPYAGVCSYGVSLNNNVKYVGQEISPIYSSIGQLALLFNDKVGSVCVQGDSFNDWLGTFDYIISTPPFGLRIEGCNDSIDIINFVRSATSARRRSVGVYYDKLCFHKHFIRTHDEQRDDSLIEVIEKDWIECVILLPEKLFASTSIGSVIITTNKDKLHKGHVKFIDASECFNNDGRLRLLDIQKILELCSSEDSDKVKLSSLDDIRSMNYQLYPPLYTVSPEIDVPEGQRRVSLSDLLVLVGMQKPTEKKGRLYSFQTLAPEIAGTMKVSGIIDANDIPVRDLPPHDMSSFSEDSIIVRRQGDFKFYLIKTKGERVYIQSSMYYVYTIRKDIINPEFLLKGLKSSYFVQQVSRYGRVNGSFNMGRMNLLDMKILVPYSKEEQLLLSEEQRDELWASFIKKHESIIEQRMESFVLNQRQRKHAVQQVLNEILPSVQLIDSLVRSSESINKDTVVSRRYGTTLGQYMSSILSQVNKVVDMVDNFTAEETYGEPEEINLVDFLQEYCDSKVTGNYRATFNHIYEDEEFEQYVKISRRDLTQMLDNIFSNAVKYGFIDKNRNDYTIKVETKAIHRDDEPIVITISNNGVPASKTISVEKMFTWGIGQGTGIGCWQVKEIAEHYGGTASYQEYPNDPDGFVCEFSISLPLSTD